jgi:hypothetical protein
MKLINMIVASAVVIGVAGYGWVMNIIIAYRALAAVVLFTSGASIDGTLILRLIGIPIVPLGAVLGYI